MSTLRLLVTLLLVMVSVGLCSCVDKVYTPDVEVRKVHKIEYIFYQDKSYSGKVYSSDESCFVVVENGSPIKAVAYHSNGQVAVESVKVGSEFDIKYYDDKGYPLSEGEFDDKYEGFIKSLKNKLPVD